MIRRPSSLAATGPSASWSSGPYSYDGAGNIKAIGTSVFTYDPVSRLVSASLNDGPTGTGTQKQQSYTFDAFGNLQAIAGTSGRSTPTSSQTNRLSGAVTYDAAGNLIAWNGATYAYDAFNQMVQMMSGTESWAYLYTADDERVWSYDLARNASHWTVRDLGGKVLRDYQNNQGHWSVGTDYVYRDGLLLAAETQTGQRHFHLDHLGTPRLITRASGERVAYHVYYPFGEELTAFNQDTERMKFTGHERDLASAAGAGDDLDYMHARFYSPLLGRFLSTDRAPGKARVPQSWNRYSYVQGNPLKFVDPNGADTTTATGGPSYGEPESQGQWEATQNAGVWLLSTTEILAGLAISSEDPEHGQILEEAGEAGAEKSLATIERDEASAFSGRRGANFTQAEFQPRRNESGVVSGRMYSGHAFDQMQDRGTTPTVIENTIKNGTASAGKISGTTAYFDAANGIKVIVDTKTGRVVTVMYASASKKDPK